MENVKGLAIHAKGRTLKTILNTLDEVGYVVPEPQIVNAMFFGVPQHRERIYIVGFRKDLGLTAEDFSYPEQKEVTKKWIDVREENPVPAKYYLSTRYQQTLINHKARHAAKGNGFGYDIIPDDGIAHAIVVGGMGRESNLVIDFRQKDLTPTTNIKGTVNTDGWRKMTPREWARLQGYPDNFKIVVADASAYKQFGNSVAVPAIQATAAQLLKSLNDKIYYNMAVWQFNRGEWTEAYVFMRLLGDGRIYGASSELTKDDSTYIDIINIIREEPDKMLIFERFVDENIAYIKASKDDKSIKVVTAPEFSKYAQVLYDNIKTLTTNHVTSVAEVQNYLESLGIDTPKANLSKSAKEKYGAKTDVIITSEDSLDHTKTTEGFSVKSHIGSPATLFNCSPTSGFTFEVVGCDEKGMHEINAKDAFLSIMEVIKEKYSLEYVGCRNEAFEQNIAFVDSRMEEVLSAAVLAHASYYGACGSNVKDVCNKVVGLNPINVRNPQMFYSAKFKDFLFDSFAGMTASSLWNGRKRLTGGYIDVSRDGEMLYYRAMSDDILATIYLRTLISTALIEECARI